MIARVQTMQLAPGGLARTLTGLQGNELRVLRDAPGCAATLVLATASGERLDVISLWADADVTRPFDTPAAIRTYEVALLAGMPGSTVARVISVHLNPGNIDTVVTIFENVVMHAATAQHGFRRGLLLVDRANDDVISIGLWSSENDLLASERIGYLSKQIGNFTHIVADPIVPEMLSVVVEE